MSDIKAKYPATDTTAITCDVSSLATSTSAAGRASTVVDNTSNLDLDHLVSAMIKLGTSPTANKPVSVFAYAAHKIASGSYTYPDGITGSDAAKTMTSVNVMNGALRLLWTGLSDATTGRVLYMPPTSVANAFGGMLPPKWGIFVTHETGVNLDSTAGNHEFHYQRIQGQTV